MMHLNEVLKMLRGHGLVANQKKCYFIQTKVEYLGHIILLEGVAVDLNKVQYVQD